MWASSRASVSDGEYYCCGLQRAFQIAWQTTRDTQDLLHGCIQRHSHPHLTPRTLKFEPEASSRMHHPDLQAVAIAFWIFITVVSVAGMIMDYRKRQLAL